MPIMFLFNALCYDFFLLMPMYFYLMPFNMILFNAKIFYLMPIHYVLFNAHYFVLFLFLFNAHLTIVSCCYGSCHVNCSWYKTNTEQRRLVVVVMWLPCDLSSGSRNYSFIEFNSTDDAVRWMDEHKEVCIIIYLFISLSPSLPPFLPLVWFWCQRLWS